MTERRAARFIVPAIMIAGMLLLSSTPARPQTGAPPAGTPAEMVATYNTLADAILAVKRTEANLVRSIFGLGTAEMVDLIDVRWPDGGHSIREKVLARQQITIQKGS